MQQQRTQERVQRRKAPQPTNRAAAPAQLPPLRRKQPQQNLPVVEFRHAKRLSRALEGVNRYLSAYGGYPLPENNHMTERHLPTIPLHILNRGQSPKQSIRLIIRSGSEEQRRRRPGTRIVAKR